MKLLHVYTGSKIGSRLKVETSAFEAQNFISVSIAAKGHRCIDWKKLVIC